MNRPDRNWRDYAAITGRGVLMGAADIIPGVSGGTVALIVGIYAHLVGSISHFDGVWIALVARRRWKEASQRVDLPFLAALAVGIAGGLLTLGFIIHALFESDFARPLTWAAFFGMISASAYLVARMIRVAGPREGALFVACGISGAAFAWWLTTLQTQTGQDPTPLYLFFCGMVAICAMILPGISGAHILMIFGVYFYLTGAIKELLHGRVAGDALIAVPVFGLGCAIGLVGFSKVLRLLLAHHHSPTMAVLCGFMLGALRKVWPFQIDQTPGEVEFKHKIFEPNWTPAIGGHELLAIAVAVGAFAGVLLFDYVARRRRAAHA